MYGWIITRDTLPFDDLGDVGTIGPSNCKLSVEEIKKGKPFRMYDDDGELYYEGFIAGDFEGFEPLDDFGGPNSGCN